MRFNYIEDLFPFFSYFLLINLVGAIVGYWISKTAFIDRCFAGREAEIGMTLIACSFPAWILIMMWVALLFPQQSIPLSLRDSVWVFVTVLAIAGLLLYIIGRERFLNRTRKNRVLPALSLSLGLWLSILGLFNSWVGYSMTEYHAGKIAIGGRSYDDVYSFLLIKGSPIYFWLILLTISGIITSVLRREIYEFQIHNSHLSTDAGTKCKQIL